MKKTKTTILSRIALCIIIAVGVVMSFTRSGETAVEAAVVSDTVQVAASSAYEIPRYTKEGQQEQLLQRKGYTASYNCQTRCANWVGWALTAEHTDGDYSRKNHKFMEDMDVPEPRATYADIRESESGYQRGHLCPSGDNKWSFQAQEDAFLMTNICPQDGELNQKDWKYLEQACQTWAKRYGVVYIVTGPVFRSTNYKTVGEHEIAVPDAFFKVVLAGASSGSSAKAIGFLYENKPEQHDMEYYVRTVDEIEKITGLDFFYPLDDSIEDVVESRSNLNEW